MSRPGDIRDLLGMGDTVTPVTITDPDPLIEAQLRQIDERQNKVIVGLDGRPLLKPVVDDRTITYARDGEAYTAQPDEILIKAARMFRDGMSLRNIAAELDLITSGPMAVPMKKLEAAILRFGMPWLDDAIAAGREPAESKTVVGYQPVEPPEDDAQAAADAEGEVETRTVKMTPAMSRKIMRAINRGKRRKN